MNIVWPTFYLKPGQGETPVLVEIFENEDLAKGFCKNQNRPQDYQYKLMYVRGRHG